MRAFFDANVFISFLLAPFGSSAPSLIIRAGFGGAYTVLVSQTVLTELRARVASKPYLATRISADDLAAFAALLADAAEIVPEIPEPFPQVGRDRKDDYLYAHALVGRADYLVSGDDDLLAVGHIERIQIVSPATFLQILRNSGLIDDPSGAPAPRHP